MFRQPNSQDISTRENIDSDLCQQFLGSCLQVLGLSKIQRHIFICADQTKLKFCSKRVWFTSMELSGLTQRHYIQRMTIDPNFTLCHVRQPSFAERNRLTIFIQKTNSSSSQITFILIEGCFNWSVRYFDNNPCLN